MSPSTLVLTLRGPQQAWGASSRFATRATEQAPTRSGVFGLVAAALGMERTESLDRFNRYRFGVRVDRQGRVERDFQTAHDAKGVAMPLSHRYYLADACFRVGIEADDAAELNAIAAAFRAPVFPLYLGRRAFPPAGPIHVSLHEGALRDTLLGLGPIPGVSDEGPVTLIVDAERGEVPDFSVDDIPVSFDPRRRRYLRRDVKVVVGSVPAGGSDHDAMRLLDDKEV